MFSCDPYRNLKHCSKSTLKRLIENEVRAQLVNCVVGQMHKFVFEVIASGGYIRISCETGQTLLVHKYPQRVSTGHQYVDPHVEFQPVNQKGLMQISLHHAPLPFELCMDLKLLSMFLVRKMPLP